MKQEHKISIIIPIYNAEKYLFECLKSIEDQKYNNYEVIMINDGSTDKSESICKLFEKNKKFILINQQNSGVSASRNNGISHSEGDLLLFIDADDYVNEDMLKIINENINDNEMMVFGYQQCFKSKKIEYSYKYINNTELLYDIFNSNAIGGYTWNKVFRKEVIEKYKIMFNEDIHYCEDLLFVYHYMKQCNKCNCISNILYNYRMRKTSVSYNFQNEKNLSILTSYQFLINEINNNNIQNLLKYNYLFYFYKLNKTIKKYNYDYNNIIVSEQNEILVNMKFKERIKIYALKYFRRVYDFFVYTKNKVKGLYD